MRRVRFLLIVALAFLPLAVSAAVVSQPDSAAIRFAAEQLQRSLTAANADAQIVLGTYAWAKDRALAQKPAEVAEAFCISREGDRIIIAGHDEIGAMYGGLEVAEQISLGGLASVTTKTSKPLLAVRQIKYNFPTPLPEWFHREEYWQNYFDLMARSRINSIGFWAYQPFPHMTRLKDFPEAAMLMPDETERNLQTWSMILRLARQRGLSTWLINWNIHLPEPFAKAHGLKPEGEDAPVVRRFFRSCVAETLKTYPDLTGIGACAGEQMPCEDYDWREQWIKDTFVAGIKDSGRTVPLLHRYWWTSSDSIKRIISDDYAGPVWVSVKFNGEHMYTGLRPHFLDPDWIDFPDYLQWLQRKPRKDQEEIHGIVSHLDWIPQKPYPYKVIWHLRNDCIFTYRWADPEFVRSVVRNCAQDYSVGYLMGEERNQPGLDTSLTAEARAWQTWKYEHERHWFRYMIWGRLGYDPTIADTHWGALFEQRFGPSGRDLLTAYQQVSRVIPLTSRFHFNYMNGDWAPEWCTGGWNTGFGRGFNWRDGRHEFHDVVEFVFNHTIEDGILDIPEYVGMQLRKEAVPTDVLTPEQVADHLSQSAATARAAVELVRAAGQPEGEAGSMCQEFAALAEMGDYYAEKIRGATDLMRWFATAEEPSRGEAVAHLRQAADHWRRLADLAGAHYRQAAEGRHSYRRLLPLVERDVLLAETSTAAPDAIAALGLSARAKDRPRFDFSDPDLRRLVTEKLVPGMAPLYLFDRVKFSPKTANVLVLGNDAGAFNQLPAAKKQRILDAVWQGMSLVLFFQNFPEFDARWLPGGVAGSDHDASKFTWTQPDHPLAKGVDPSQLEGLAVLNDRLIAGKDWQNLTEPSGGLLVCQHGQGKIIFCQIDVLARYREPAAQQLVRNILRFAVKDKPRIVLLDGSGQSVARMLDKTGLRYQWIDELLSSQ